LLADFELKGAGLLFPNAKTGRPEKHFLRIIERLAGLAQVQGTTAKLNRGDEEVKDNWIHRFRDTYITNRVGEAQDMRELHTVIAHIGHSNFETLRAYTALVDMKSQRTRDVANKIGQYGTKPGPQLVQKAG
jgi:hypothetical protein